MANTNELLEAIELLEKEKNISRQVIIDAIVEALQTAVKQSYKHTENITVSVDPETIQYHVVVAKTVVEEVSDDELEISLEEAREYDGKYQVGDVVNIEIKPKEFGRIAASSAKNVMLQPIREEERRVIYNEYAVLEKKVVTGIVQRQVGKNYAIDLGNADATLYVSEQIKGEVLKPKDRIKVYILEVKKGQRGLKISVSRTHPELVKKLFEEEVTEIRDGIVEIKSIAREAGSRTKIAVWSNDPDVDPVGACVGMNGARVNAIVDELGDEKIDIVNWDETAAYLIQNALSPAPVISVIADSEEHTAKVVVPDKKLSLAIGKEGQNARLAAHLTGYKIDIKSESQAIEAGDFFDYDDEYYDDEEEYYDDEYVEESTEEAMDSVEE